MSARIDNLNGFPDQPAHGMTSTSAADVWTLVVVLLLIGFDVFSAPLRFYLSRYGVSVAFYLPQALAAMTILYHLLRSTLRLRASRVLLSFLVTLTTFALVGLLQIGNVRQVLFGIWVWLPFSTGIIAYRSFQSLHERYRLWSFWLFLCVAGGVAMELVISYPWAGFEYELAGQSIQSSRQWSTGGLMRLAGFSRASYEAAIQAVLLALFASVFEARRWRQLALMGLSLIVAALTTSKTAVVVSLLLSLFLVTWKGRLHTLWRPILVAGAVVTFLLPISTLWHTYQLETHGVLDYVLWGSFLERLTDTWPAVFRLVASDGNWVMGRGVGGLGAAQLYFEPSRWNTGDNLPVYLFGIFGLVGIAGYSAFILRSLALRFRIDELDRFFFCLALAVVGFGATVSVVESPVFSLFMGLSLAHLFGARYRATGVQS